MVDNGGTVDVVRLLGLARAVSALLEGGDAELARPLVGELVRVLEASAMERDGGAGGGDD